MYEVPGSKSIELQAAVGLVDVLASPLVVVKKLAIAAEVSTS